MGIKFGAKGKGKPTPGNVSRFLDIYAASAGVISAWVITAGYIPHSVSDVISSILTMTGSLALAIKPYFHVDTTRKKIPVGQVKEIESEKEN